MNPGQVWTPDRDAELRRLWATGEVCNKIALAMGLSKNAVIGRSHRLNLPKRPSPIVRKVSIQAKAVASKPIPVIQMKKRAALYAFPTGCRWIKNDDTQNPNWCDRPRAEGKPYCDEHCRRAYMQKGDKDELSEQRLRSIMSAQRK